MTELGLSSYAYYWASQPGAPWADGGPMGPVDLVNATARHGLAVLQLCENVAAFDPADPEQVRAVRAAAERAGVRLELGCRADTADGVRVSLDHAASLGAELLRVVPWSRAEKPHGDGEAALLAALRSVEGHQRDVRIAIENYPGLSDRALADVVTALDDERVGVTLDTANSVGRLARPLETVDVLAPHALSVHLKDFVIHKEAIGYRITGTPLGDGDLDVSAVVTAMSQAKRRPALLIELWLDPGSTPAVTLAREAEWVARSVAYAKGLLVADTSEGDRSWN